MKKVCIIAGNCNAGNLHFMLELIPELQEVYELHFVRLTHSQKEERLFSHEKIRDCSLLLFQVGHWGSLNMIKEVLPRGCRVILYPTLNLQSLWPFHCKDPRNKPEEGFEAGRYPYGDSIVVRLLRKGLNPEQTFQAYLDTDIHELIDLDQYHQLCMEKGRDIDRRSDIPLNGYMEEHFRDERMFWTFNHPAPNLIFMLARAILKELGWNELPPAAVERYLSKSPLDNLHWPIHPQVISHYGLQWADGSMKYQHFQMGRFTHDEFMKRYIAFE